MAWCRHKWKFLKRRYTLLGEPIDVFICEKCGEEKEQNG